MPYNAEASIKGGAEVGEKKFKLGSWNFTVGDWRVRINDTKFEHPLSVASLCALLLLFAVTVAQVILTILSALSFVLYFLIGGIFVFSLSHYALRLFGRRGFFHEEENEVVNPETNEKTKSKRYELDFENALEKKV